MLNVSSAYALQVGCIREEKEAFWLDLDETVEKIPKNERIVVGADLNGQVEEGNNGDEECMGRHGLGRRNNEGQAVVDFAKRKELAITHTYYVKKPALRVTYNSGGRSSQVDYIIVRRRRIKEVVDTKVIVNESVAKQHRIVVSAIIIWTKWRKAPKPVKRIKWWKLKDLKVKNKFKMAKARNKAYEELHEKLETKEEENELLKIAKQRNRQSKDVQQVRVIKSKTGEILMEEEKVKHRWKEYFDDLLNQENPRERREMRTEETKRDVEDISVEVRTSLRKIKKGKAQGPDDILVEV